MLCPIKENCPYREEDVNMIRCNSCMSKKILNAKQSMINMKEKHEILQKARSMGNAYSSWTNSWNKNSTGTWTANWQSNTSTSIIGN